MGKVLGTVSGCNSSSSRSKAGWPLPWLWIGLGVLCVGAAGCAVSPPLFPSSEANAYCADFLKFARQWALVATVGFLVFLCITVGSGFLAAQLNNNQSAESMIRRNQSTLLFVIAVLSGILGAYCHSRADSASTAAAEVLQAMTSRNDGRRYNACLVAASHWDGSLSQSLDAANLAASKSDTNGTVQLADAFQKSGDARKQLLGLTKDQADVLRTVLDTLEKTIPPGKASKTLKENLDAARTKLDQGAHAINAVESIGTDEKKLVDKVQKSLRSGDEDQAEAKPAPRPAEPAPSPEKANPSP